MIQVCEVCTTGHPIRADAALWSEVLRSITRLIISNLCRPCLGVMSSKYPPPQGLDYVT